MQNKNIEELLEGYEKDLAETYKFYDKVRKFNQKKVLEIFKEEKLSHTDFHWTTGYGYSDYGRDKTERIFAKIFKTEDALVRTSIASGTHALSIVLKAILMPNDELISLSGTVYDTLLKVIGVKGNEPCNLKELGVNYKELPLNKQIIDFENIASIVKPTTKMVTIQRSMGYSQRRAHTIDEIAKAISIVKNINPNIIVMVDNCYGEFTDFMEPSEVGADIIAGSLIKNLGAGMALSGGYIAGKSSLIERCANIVTAPGLGKETGLSFGQTRNILQGLFYAPQIVNNAMKGATLVGYAFRKLGYKIVPETEDKRSDIVQGILLENKELVVKFCQLVQEFGAVDSHVIPTPWDMPGYDDQVVMAAGGFIEGSSIELSADGPLRKPYTVYFQGGTSYDQVVLFLEKALEYFTEKKI